MARGYLFFRPQRLPLEWHELSDETVVSLCEAESRSGLERVVPGLEWHEEYRQGRATVDGRWLEFYLPRAGVDSTLGLRCSLRSDHTALVQSYCDTLGWIAFDDFPLLIQPHRPPTRSQRA